MTKRAPRADSPPKAGPTPNPFYLENHFSECSFCKRPILVQLVQFGISHVSNVIAACADCIRTKGIGEKYREQNPRGAKEIEEWLAAGPIPKDWGERTK